MVDPTPEQAEAIATYGDGLDMVMQAGAGCGKSSTLKLIAKSDPRRRMLYVAYNRSIAADAARSMPGNVVAKTGHGLAFNPRHLPRLKQPRQTAHAAAEALGVKRILGILGTAPAIPTDRGATLAMLPRIIMRVALETVTRWCYSADREIRARHVPEYRGLTSPVAREQLLALVLPVALAAWADLTDPAGVLRMQHDHYLKMWALSGPTLAADTVLLDEAQDTNDVLSHALMGQEHAQRIAVGDSAQQIYAWRGARDALGRFRDGLGAPELTLSQSFRFGPAIADTANVWLALIDAPLRLRGWDGAESTVGSVEDPDAVLCRTNAGAIAVVLDALAAGRRVALVGGGDDAKRLAWAAEALMQGRQTDHPELMAFTSWSQVREYAEDEDGSLRTLVRLIDAHGPQSIAAAADQLAPEETADLVVSTVHKAKGREWDTVTIHGDFLPPKPDRIGRTVLPREEGRLAYVAVTRARRRLDDHALAWVHSLTESAPAEEAAA
ncbi:UvrD-helicase domain-containing protein [Streptomyces carpaticus]|uniref:3'-5' exonuclease n=1 Tax=Streptomyces carpaticus TaxID=285558 RepID=UPI00220E7A57|nr:UvrD-helicase domain-containing protein [Streptomyces carpaticus]